MKYRLALLIFVVLSVVSVFAQNKESIEDREAIYTRSINSRAGKIVASLDISDSSKAHRVKNIIANQYRYLNAIHTERDEKIKSARASGSQKNIVDDKIMAFETQANLKLDSLHATYLSKLASELSSEQITQVKDGMTYGVVPITYKGYLEMLPDLTEKQKEQIMIWLVEAREHAMDAESSEKKHWWFGKYKGRINNYLAASGIDLKKAGEDWEKKRKAAASSQKHD